MENNIKKLIDIIPIIFGNHRIKIIVELGSRDGLNTEILHNTFPKSKVYSFECNPATIDICRKKISGLKRAKLIEKAVADKNGNLTFYPVDQDKSEKTNWSDGNPGASSLFKVSDKYDEKLVQKIITVPAIKLSSFVKFEKIKSIDLLFMDIQGAELLALKGLEEEIYNVKIIHTEASFLELYEKQPLFKDIKKFLNEKGFVLYGASCFTGSFADMIFVNSKYFNRPFSKIRDIVIGFYYSKILYGLYRVLKRFRYYKALMKLARKTITLLKRIFRRFFIL